MELTFLNMTGKLVTHEYPNGRLALTIEDDEGEIARCTTNVASAQLAEGEVLIKDYSENEGMLAMLISAGVVKDTGRRVQSGWVQIPVCELLINTEAKNS